MANTNDLEKPETAAWPGRVDPLVGPFVWSGDLDDDCSLRVGDWMAHVEMMGDFSAKLNGKKHRSERVEYWYCAVYWRDEQFYNSGDAGGFICSGDQCRAICEAIIRGR